MAETIHIAIPAVGEAYKFYARVTAESAQRGSSLPVAVHYIGEDDFRRVADVSRFSAYHGSSITWSRLYLAEMFPELDWVLSCDADIMFRGDVAELWRTSRRVAADGPWICPSRDCPYPGLPYNEASVKWLAARGLVVKKPEEYFCAGLSLFNLKAMREGGWAQMRDEFLDKYIFGGKDIVGTVMADADQCALNYLLQDRKCLLPRGWGVFSGDENADIDWTKPGAVHFVEDTPWRRWKVTHLASDLCEEWCGLARQVDGAAYRQFAGCHGCKNALDWLWRRFVFVALKHNQWILKLNRKLWIHLRSTRGVRP